MPSPDLNHYHVSGDGNVLLTWGPPDLVNITSSLNHVGYTVTCTATLANFTNTISVSLDTSSLNTTITGLRLMEFDYECCVFADYVNYHPKDCTMVNKTEEPSTALATDGPTEPATDVPTELGSTTARQTTGPEDTMITPRDPSTSSSTFPAASVAAGVLGAVILLLLILLCALCVLHKHWRTKSASMHLG